MISIFYDPLQKVVVVDDTYIPFFGGDTLEEPDIILAKLAAKKISLQEASTLMHRYIRDEKRGLYNEQ